MPGCNGTHLTKTAHKESGHECELIYTTVTATDIAFASASGVQSPDSLLCCPANTSADPVGGWFY